MKTHGTDVNLNQLVKARPTLTAIVGIVIAVVCSWVVLHEFNKPQHESKQYSYRRTMPSISRQVVESTDFFAPSILSVLK